MIIIIYFFLSSPELWALWSGVACDCIHVCVIECDLNASLSAGALGLLWRSAVFHRDGRSIFRASTAKQWGGVGGEDVMNKPPARRLIQHRQISSIKKKRRENKHNVKKRTAMFVFVFVSIYNQPVKSWGGGGEPRGSV